jgi:hypothetical protein
MVDPFPQGTLSIIEAVNWLAQRRDDEWTKQEAWRAICEAIRKGTLPAYVLDQGGRSHEADRAQFASLHDRDPMYELSFREFEGAPLQGRDVTYFPSPARARMLLTVSEHDRRVSGRLFFFESDFEAVFCTEKDEAPDDIEAECNTWLAALPEHPRLKKKQAFERFNRFRREADRKTIGGRPFNRAWEESAHPTWHARGRLPST